MTSPQFPHFAVHNIPKREQHQSRRTNLNCKLPAYTRYLLSFGFYLSDFSTLRLLLISGYSSSTQRAANLAKSGRTPPHATLQLQVTARVLRLEKVHVAAWVPQVSTFLDSQSGEDCPHSLPSANTTLFLFINIYLINNRMLQILQYYYK